MLLAQGTEGIDITTNIHGLSRYIPEDVRRQIRQECGFGCVECGLAIIQYEHIDPTFAEAKVHDPKKMALLCGVCHDRVTKNYWSKSRILAARESPKTFKQGFAKDAFDFQNPFELWVGNSHFKDIHCIVRDGTGEEWFTIEPPEVSEGPPQISAKFFGESGLPELEIVKNEWRCSIGIWDLQIIGPVIEIRSSPDQVMLRLKARPPHGLEIQYLNMAFGDIGIIVEDGTVRLLNQGTEITMNCASVSNANSVFSLP